jgi:hypothetical protein
VVKKNNGIKSAEITKHDLTVKNNNATETFKVASSAKDVVGIVKTFHQPTLQDLVDITSDYSSLYIHKKEKKL